MTWNDPRLLSSKAVYAYIMICVCALLGCEEARRVTLDGGQGGEAAGAQAGEVAGSQAGGQAGDQAGVQAGDEAGSVMSEAPFASLKPSLKLKDHRVLKSDLSALLKLNGDELCKELGNFSCLDVVHRVTLGGVAAERQGVYTPSELSSVTAPIALERVIYSACGVRVRRDFNPEEERDGLFGSLELTSGGLLTEPRGEQTRRVITTLYQQALLRNPSEEELEELVVMYEELVEAGVPLPGPSWAWGMCFAVLTSTEFLFY